jgi:hypothetical protein
MTIDNKLKTLEKYLNRTFSALVAKKHTNGQSKNQLFLSNLRSAVA